MTFVGFLSGARHNPPKNYRAAVPDDVQSWVSPQNWKLQFDSEIARGYSARAEGNEGRARVCARRALAVALEEFLGRRGDLPDHWDAVTLIQRCLSQANLPQDVQEKMGHFLVRVEPGGRFPIEADLLDEARWICGELAISQE